MEEIAREKRRLEQMQLEYAEKLSRLQMQAQKKAAAATAASKPQPLPRLEKIALDCTDESEYSDHSQNAKPVVPMRRKSLIMLNSNMKPEIVQNKENIQFDLAVPHLPSENQEDCFKMPESSQLTSLRKVLVSNFYIPIFLMKVLRVNLELVAGWNANSCVCNLPCKVKVVEGGM